MLSAKIDLSNVSSKVGSKDKIDHKPKGGDKKVNGTPCENIRIYHEYENGIEKSVPRITVWHHEACRVITNNDPEGRIFLFHSHTNNGCFFLLMGWYGVYGIDLAHMSKNQWKLQEYKNQS